MSNWNTHDLAYFAGLLDGEGTFTVYKSAANTSAVYNALISIALTAEEGIAWISERFGGNTYKTEMAGNRAIQTQWQLRNKDALIELLDALVPFLLLKQTHARLLLKYCIEYKHNPRGKRVSAEDVEIRNAYCTIFSELNARGKDGPAKKKKLLDAFQTGEVALPVIVVRH